MSRAILWGLAVWALMVPGIAVADEAPAVDIKRLTLDSAVKVAQAAVADCARRGIPVGVVVVDRGGHVQAALRDTLAPDLTLRVAKDKAYTAMSFNVPTSQLARRAKSPLGQLDGLVMSPGGLPIAAGGHIYGAVGVSGAPSGKTDEACAQAGINTITEALEFQ